MKEPKVLLITNVISPYRIPVFNYLARNVDIMFVFLGGMLSNLKLKVYWDEIKFNYRILKGKEIFFPHREFTFHLNQGFLRLLMKENPDVIVSLGYTYIESIIGLIYAQLKNRMYVLWSGSTLNSTMSKSLIINRIKRIIIKNCDSFLSYGSDAADYLIHHGANKDKIIISCNTIELEKFYLKSKEFSVNRELVKIQYNLPKLNILFCGQLIPRKNLITLINAFKLLNNKDCALIILGDGPKKEEYETYCIKNIIRNVFFRGHQDFEEIVKYYAISDVFVLPSYREVWGLVVNEAMACGLPILCSNRAGVASDLVKNGVNGYTFDPEDVYDLTQKLRQLINDDKKRKEMNKNSIKIIKNYTPQKYADDLLKAISLAYN
jgi:glycosyltransferase involved in cell wall biosynthesis